MALFKFTGIKSDGTEVKSTINIESVGQAKQKIKSMGIMLIEIKEQQSGAGKQRSTMAFGKNVAFEDLSMMTRQLATLIKAKIQIPEALLALADQSDNPLLKVILSEIRQKVNEGSSLAKALSDYPKVFNNIYINMVEAGEQSGNLGIVLLRLAEFSENQVKLRNKIKSSMTYPVIMIVIGSLLIGAIFVQVIPQITKIFVSMKKTLPIQTEICIWISNFLISYWWMVILGVTTSFYMFKKYITTKNGESWWHGVHLKLPMIKTIITMINVGRFCSTLATLRSSGVPILVAMRIVKNLVGNVHMQKAIDESKDCISEGAPMVGPLIKSGLFPPMVTHMISLGEKSGEIVEMLNIVAENYDDQVNTKLSGLTSVLEPIMMIGMGVVVAFVVWAVVVPLMDLSSLPG